MSTVFLLIVFLPIIGSVITGLAGTEALKRITGARPGRQPYGHGGHDRAHGDGHEHHEEGLEWTGLLTSALLLVTMALSWYAFFDVAVGERTYKVEVFRWI